MAAFLHGLLHLFFHLVRPNESLGSLDSVLSNGGLLLGVSVAAVLLVTVTRTPEGQTIPVGTDSPRTTESGERRTST